MTNRQGAEHTPAWAPRQNVLSREHEMLLAIDFDLIERLTNWTPLPIQIAQIVAQLRVQGSVLCANSANGRMPQVL